METVNGLPSYLLDPATFDQRFSPDWLKPPVLLNNVQTYWDQGATWFHQFFSSGALIPLLIVSGAVATMLFLVWRDGKLAHKTSEGEAAMRRWERQRQLKTILADILTDVVEDARYKDLITKGEKHQLYKGFAKTLDLPDLIVTSHPSRKKAESRKRREANALINPNLPVEETPTPSKVVQMHEHPVKKNRRFSMLSAKARAAAL